MLGVPARCLHLEGPPLPGLLRRYIVLLVLAERCTPGEDVGAQMLAVFTARRDDVYSLLLRVPCEYLAHRFQFARPQAQLHRSTSPLRLDRLALRLGNDVSVRPGAVVGVDRVEVPIPTLSERLA